MKPNFSSCVAVVLSLIIFNVRAQNTRWATYSDGPSDEFARHSVTFSTGVTFVTGQFSDSMRFDPGPNEFWLKSMGGSDIFLSIYDVNGQLLTAKQLGGPGDDEVSKLHCDEMGMVYLCGAFEDSIAIHGVSDSVVLKADGNKDGLVAKFTIGGDLIWGKAFNGGDVIVTDVTAMNGDCYVVGNFWNSVDLDPSAYSEVKSSVGMQDFFVAQLDFSGNLIWGHAMGSEEMDRAQACDLNSAGELFIAGTFADILDFDPGPGGNQWYPPGGGQYDVFILKLNSIGQYVKHGMIGGNFNENVHDMAIKGLDDIVLTGGFSGNCNFNPQQGTPVTRSSVGGVDLFILKLNAMVELQWVRLISGQANEEGYGIALSNELNVLVTGYFDYVADLDPGEYELQKTTVGNADALFVVLNSSGDLQCAGTMGGPGADIGRGAGFDALSNFYVTGAYAGYYQGESDFDPGAATENLPSADSTYDIFAASYRCDLFTGMQDRAAFAHAAYPNPTSGMVSFRTLSPGSPVEILNGQGQLKWSGNIDGDGRLDLSGFRAGLYFVKTAAPESRTTFKVVKE